MKFNNLTLTKLYNSKCTLWSLDINLILKNCENWQNLNKNDINIQKIKTNDNFFDLRLDGLSNTTEPWHAFQGAVHYRTLQIQ